MPSASVYTFLFICGYLLGSIPFGVVLARAHGVDLQRVGSRAKLLVSSGNHDLNARGAHGEKVARWLERAAGVFLIGFGIRLVRD